MNALTKARDLAAAAYLMSDRHADLPILVRAWFAQVEGWEQDEILSLSVGARTEHPPRGEYDITPRESYQCESCAASTTEPSPWRLVLAESEACPQTTVEGPICPICAESWSLAEIVFKSRSIAPARPDGDLEIVRSLIAAIPANDSTVSKRAAALAYVDDMIDRRVG